MKAEVAIAILSVIMAILGIGLTLVTAYLGYLALTLEDRLRSTLQSDAAVRHDQLRDTVAARLLLVDLAVEALCVNRKAGEGDGLPEGDLYFLQHIGRLASNDPEEIGKALGALEAGGEAVVHLLPYVERVRTRSNWPTEANRRFETLLRQIREGAQKKHEASQQPMAPTN